MNGEGEYGACFWLGVLLRSNTSNRARIGALACLASKEPTIEWRKAEGTRDEEGKAMFDRRLSNVIRLATACATQLLGFCVYDDLFLNWACGVFAYFFTSPRPCLPAHLTSVMYDFLLYLIEKFDLNLPEPEKLEPCVCVCVFLGMRVYLRL